ncbi:MAG: hypothetical protein CV089_02330 [Nitrospira sp. WS110]|nr:hypothetical protein [Nitrospira sp. WS110]
MVAQTHFTTAIPAGEAYQRAVLNAQRLIAFAQGHFKERPYKLPAWRPPKHDDPYDIKTHVER